MTTITISSILEHALREAHLSAHLFAKAFTLLPKNSVLKITLEHTITSCLDLIAEDDILNPRCITSIDAFIIDPITAADDLTEQEELVLQHANTLYSSLVMIDCTVKAARAAREIEAQISKASDEAV